MTYLINQPPTQSPERRPVRFGRYLFAAAIVTAALLAILNWESVLSVMFGLAVLGFVLLLVGLLLLRLVVKVTGISGTPILAAIVGFIVGRISRR